MSKNREQGIALGQTLMDFYRCVTTNRDANGNPTHPYNEQGVCPKCGAVRGNPSLLDLLATRNPAGGMSN